MCVVQRRAGPCWDYMHCHGACLATEPELCVPGGIGTCSEDIVMYYLGCQCYFENGVPVEVCGD